jgi:hypothetical protein
MRQAGRYLPQYMAVRSKCTFLELCKTPELAAEVTIQPIDYLGADAAILFSDILTPVEPMGLKLDFVPGPVFETPVRSMADVQRLIIPDPEEGVPYVMETIRILRRAFEGRVPLIGFGGAPFTLACYMVEGKGSKDFAHIKKMMYAAPEVFAALMDKITEMDRLYLNAQVKAGAQAIQIFDTWGGIVSPSDYEKYVLPYTKKLIDGLDRSVPVIHFVKGAGTMLDLVKRQARRFECGWPRLACQPRPGARCPWLADRRAGESRSDRALCAACPYRARGQADPRRERRPPGAHFQPRPRHPAERATGECEVHGRVRASVVGPIENAPKYLRVHLAPQATGASHLGFLLGLTPGNMGDVKIVYGC